MAITKEHTIWVEKYRPKTLQEYVCTDKVRDKMQEYIDNQDIPHLLFPGTPGAGKTTLARILASNINCDLLYINATEDRDMETIKDKVGKFAAAASFKPLKIIILDEATHILQASQVLLLNMIETYSLKTRFILTGNYVERLIPALKSRLQQHDLITPDKKQIALTVTDILDKEEIEYDIKDVAFIINNFYPDQRAIINNLQKNTSDNKLVINQNEILAKDEYVDKIINELKKPSSKSFNIIRQYVVDSKIGDFENVYKQLYDRLDDYCGNAGGSITIKIEEYLYHKNFRVDQEINIMACIASIIEIVNNNKLIKG
ncbi:MAG: AAA family ATPase [Nanoarchaeota archaeon]